MLEAERKYWVTGKENLAVISSVKKFRHYLEGFYFMVIADHSSLRLLRNLRNPTGRLVRWKLDLIEYDFDVAHRKGVSQRLSDALSRI